MTFAATLVGLAAKPIVRRIFAAIQHSAEIREMIARQIAKQEQEAVGRIDPAKAERDAQAIGVLIADVALALEENERLQAEIRAGMDALPSARREP